ncbi:MAG: type II toxin-antitoxin system VapC family toxin [Acidobacteriota bacterium]
MSTEVASCLDRWSRISPARRNPDQLPFFDSGLLPEPVLYDTTVYIDTLHNKLPHLLEGEIARVQPWHCSVVESELVCVCGRLDPAHSGTAEVVRRIAGVVDHWPADRVLTPDRDTWREAALLTGIISRLHQAKAEDRGRTMNDALIFLSALRNGCTVLSRNVRDFDLLTQMEPEGRVVFYRTV